MKGYLENEFSSKDAQLVDTLDELSLWSAPFGLKLLDGIRYKKNIASLDIGFGNGFPLIEIAMRLGKSSKVFGMDLWDEAIERAEKKISLYKVKNIEIIRGSAEDMPFEGAYFDLITSNNGLNNIENPDKALSECYRVLKPGGQFIQSFNLEGTMSVLYQAMEEVLLKEGMMQHIGLMKSHIFEKRKPLELIVKKLEDQGFIVNSITRDTFSYKFVDGTTMFEYFFIRFAFLESWKKIIEPEKQEYIFDGIERKLNQIAELQGTLMLDVPFVVIDCLK
ncbi:MAG: class I SAM-dependent methyltransferase [Bacteroidales bacterium]|nr:class I SAM-dependent methyltransferase [Bacteroidales bacterium]